MRLIISAQEPSPDGPVDRRFGRSSWLVSVDSETGKWKAFENPGASQSGGAGVAAAQFVIDQKAEVVISGDFGPHAAGAFRVAGIKMRLFIEEVTSVQSAVTLWSEEKLLVFH